MKRTVAAFVAAAALASLAPAQTITGVAPAASSPGELLTVEGTGLAGATHVRFEAFVGGFVGVWTQDEPVLTASATSVTVLAPDIVAGFVTVGPSAGSPLGELAAVVGGVATNELSFYYFEGTDGFLENAGLGSTQSLGQRGAISFALPGGPPTSGNPAFTPTLHRAVPGALPFLAIGAPGPPLPIGDGILVVDLGVLYAVVPGAPVGPGGNSSAAVPVPLIPAGVDVMMQWGYLEPLTGVFQISNGVQASY